MSQSLIITQGNTLPAEARQRIAEWASHAGGAFSPATERAWRIHWASFTAWCSLVGSTPLPALPATVAAYLRTQSEAGLSVSTLRCRASTITKVHKLAGLDDSCGAEAVRLTMRAIARERGTDQKQAAGLTEREAQKIILRLGDSLRAKDIRDMALMLVGRDLMARASELITVRMEAITWEEDGTALVNLRRHKTSTEAHPCQLGTDATEALRRWLTLAGIEAGRVFMSLTKGGKLTGRSLSTTDVYRIMGALGDRIGKHFSAHSLRVGMAQDLVADNIEGAAIMQAAGWQSPAMLARYTRKLDAKRGAIAQHYSRRTR